MRATVTNNPLDQTATVARTGLSGALIIKRKAPKNTWLEMVKSSLTHIKGKHHLLANATVQPMTGLQAGVRNVPFHFVCEAEWSVTFES